MRRVHGFHTLLCYLYTFLILGHHNISYQGHNFISKYPAFEVKGGIMWHFSEGSPQHYIIILFPFRSLWLNIQSYQYLPKWKYLILGNLKLWVNSVFFTAEILKGITWLVLIWIFSIIVPQFYTLLMSKLFSPKFRLSSLRRGLFLQGSSYCSPFLYRIECPIKGLSRGFTILNVWFYIGSHV